MSTILYVDDEQAVRTVVQRLLHRRGVTVHIAGSVAEAKEALLSREDLDGVIIDIWLGDGTAFDLHAWIREHRPALAKRTAFVTGDIAEDVEADRSLTTLGCPVFGKPLDYEALLSTVRAWGGDGRERAGGEASAAC